MPERFREAHRAGLARYLATGEAHVLNKRIELTALHRNGAEFPIELSITPVREGDTVSFNAFARDGANRKYVTVTKREDRNASSVADAPRVERVFTGLECAAEDCSVRSNSAWPNAA